MTESIQGKGRPTPKRSDSQKRRGGPVPPPPTNRRAAAKQLREKQAVERTRIRQGTSRGDERNLLPRDSGPIRRSVRDLVDSRRNLGFLLLPVAVLLVMANFSRLAVLKQVALGVWAATLLGVALDLALLAMIIRTSIRAKFPEQKKVLGHVGYGLLRSTVIRRFRMPPPQVARGAKR